MSKKKLGCLILAGAMMASVFAGCSNGTSSGSQSGNSAATGGTVTVKFWSAPQKVQYAFWSAKAKAFNATKATVNGKTITVTVQQMPESPSSEAGIQNAIVTGTIPAASENISRSFASTLATSGAVYDLQDEQWFKDAVATKQIEKTIAGWAINSKQYVLPEYVNPMTWQWNSKALKALGITSAPVRPRRPRPGRSSRWGRGPPLGRTCSRPPQKRTACRTARPRLQCGPAALPTRRAGNTRWRI